jgi:ribosome-associated protein
MTSAQELPLRGDHITLDALLKATGLAGSGGNAKAMILDGQVQVDGQVELRRGRKLRAGQLVQAAGCSVRVVAGPD